MRKTWFTWAAVGISLAGCQNAPIASDGGALQPLGNPAKATFSTEAADTPIDEIVVRYKANQEPSAADEERNHQALKRHRSTLLSRAHVLKLKTGSLDQALAKLRADPRVDYAEPNARFQATATPNDPSFGQLWGTAKIQAPSAWNVATGSAAVIVADVDTGVDYSHPDLAGGQVIKGPDFVNNDADPMDDNGHGSHVAGTIAATANNAVGIAGVAYGTKVLAIKVLGANGSGQLDAVANGILKAQQMGAKVINLSLGGPTGTATLQNAIDQVTAAGTLVVVAAGNNGTSTPSYPAAYANALSVGASDPNDARASFSNFGSWVQIAAPGVNILSTTHGSYESWSGTSMAAPHVAAAAALLLAKNPALTPTQLKQALVTSGDPVTGFSANPAVRRLNLVKALTAIGTPVPAPTTTPKPSAPAPTPTPKPSAPAPSPTPTPKPSAPTTTPSAPAGTPPQFLSASLVVNSASQVTVNWTTNLASDSQILYGTSTALGQSTAVNPAMVTSHSMPITGLKTGTQYYCQLRSKTASGAVATSGIFVFSYIYR